MKALLGIILLIVRAYCQSEDSSEESDDLQTTTVPREAVTGSFFVGEDRSETEHLLRVLLIDNGVYDKTSDPRSSDPDGTPQLVNVSMSMSLRGLMRMDEREALATVNAEMGFKWYDERLVWDPEKYQNLTVLPVRDDDIYKPDIILLNGFDGREKLFSTSMALLHSSGKVLWYPRATLTTRCMIDAYFWPYTAMDCDFKFGSALQGDHEMRLYFHTKAIYIGAFMENHRWRLVKGAQYTLPERFVELRNKYGSDLPWIRLYFEHEPNVFHYSLLFTPVVVALFGTICIFGGDVTSKSVLCLFSTAFFLTLHILCQFWIPNSPTIPLFCRFLLSGLFFYIGLLIAVLIIDSIRGKKSPPPPFVSNMARMTRRLCCGGQLEATALLTFNENPHERQQRHLANGNASSHSQYWKSFGLFLDTLLFLLYVSMIMALFMATLRVLLAKTAPRSDLLRIDLNSSHPPV